MPKRVLLALVLIASLLSLLWLASSKSTASRILTKAEPSTTPSVPSKEAVSAKLATLERGWVKNEGQWDERALFSAPGYFGTTWITKDGELLHVAVKGKESWVISERWVGGKVQAITPEEELPSKVSYFIGNDPSKHKTNLPTYRYVSLGEVWSGIEVKLKATQKTVEKLFYVKPGADPSKIVVEVGGAKGLKLSKDGEIIIQTGLGELKLSKPIAWQEKDGKKLPVEVSYKLIGKNSYSFEVAKADPSLPIVIDPILQSIYLGGSGDEYFSAFAISSTGEVYVVGSTNSNDFPGATPRDSSRTDLDVFVAKLNPSFTSIQSIYLGGSRYDEVLDFAISSTGEVYVVGSTNSNDFPGATPRDPTRTDEDIFVAKLNPSFTSIQSIYLGGSRYDQFLAFAISSTGDVYVVGYTASNDFPGATPRDPSRTDWDIFVAKLNPSFTSIQSIYLGGSGDEFFLTFAISSTGEVYVVGKTKSNDFPGATPRDPSRTDRDIFVAKLNPSFTSIQSIYLGGSEYENFLTFAISSTGEVYVVGKTDSNDFPGATPRDPTRTDEDIFVAKLNPSFTSIQSIYLGGSGYEYFYTFAISSTGEVYVVGGTNSNDFPGATPRDPSRTDWDIFVAKLNPSFTSIQSIYLGGSGNENVLAFAISSTGDVYMVGETTSNDFPGATPRDPSRTDQDIFVAKLNPSFTSIQSIYLGGSGNEYFSAFAISSTGEVYVVGKTTSNDFPGATPKDPSRTDWDIFVAKLNPSFTSIQSIYLGGSEYENFLTFAISSTGDVYVVGETTSNDFPGATPRDPSRTDRDIFVAKLNPSFTSIQSIYLGGSRHENFLTFAISSTGDVYVVGMTKSNDFPGATPRDPSRTDEDIFLAKLSYDSTGGDGGSGGGDGSGGGGSGGGGGGGGCSMTGSASSMAGFWNILVWLSVPAFVVARRIRRK